MSLDSKNDASAPILLDDRWHAELKRLAAKCLRGERLDHTLGPTDLVHEACLRLHALGTGALKSNAEIKRLAARTMRHVLVDHARRRSTAKRDATRRRGFRDPLDVPARRDDYVVAIDSALADLAAFDEGLVAVVEIMFFGGCTADETAAALELSPRTVKRRWALAKGWLHKRISDDADR